LQLHHAWPIRLLINTSKRWVTGMIWCGLGYAGTTAAGHVAGAAEEYRIATVPRQERLAPHKQPAGRTVALQTPGIGSALCAEQIMPSGYHLVGAPCVPSAGCAWQWTSR